MASHEAVRVPLFALALTTDKNYSAKTGFAIGLELQNKQIRQTLLVFVERKLGIAVYKSKNRQLMNMTAIRR